MNEHYIRPDVRAYLARSEATPRPELTEELLVQLRSMGGDLMAHMDLPVGEIAVARDITIPGPQGEIAARLYDARQAREPGPVLVFFHGGGFSLGCIDTHASLAAEIARQMDLPVTSAEYRLAPEHPWPAAPDDAEAATRWIAENGALFGRTITGLVLCGDSAGGNLAIVTTMALRDRPAALPVLLQIAIYPVADFAKDYASKSAFGDGYGLSSTTMRVHEEHYAPDPRHWRAAPVRASQAGMPATLVVTASLDPLRDEGRAYAAQTITDGVPTSYREVNGQVHGFGTFRRIIPSAQADLTAIMDVAKGMLRESAVF